MAYDKNYVTIDELGIAEIRCMRCGQTVARRKDRVVPHPTKPGEEILRTVMSQWANWRQVEIELSDGSYASMIVCQDCEKLGEFDEDKLVEQMKEAFKEELKNRSIKALARHAERVKPLKAAKIAKKEK